MSQSIDHYSFIYGMTTAFSECVSREAKRLALTPPFPVSYLNDVTEEIEKISRENGIFCWLDKNEDLPESSRVYWLVLYKFQESLSEYQKIRDSGYNPAIEFDKFYGILGYGHAWSEGFQDLTPVFRETRSTGDTPGRVLFSDGGWPPTRD